MNIRLQTNATRAFLRINTLGAPPQSTPESPSWLVNDQGLHRSRVWVEAATSCAAQPTHFVPIGPIPYQSQDWCLELELPTFGSPVTGMLVGSSAAISLTVSHQTSWWWPIGPALLGITVAFLAVLIPKTLTQTLAPQRHRNMERVEALRPSQDAPRPPRKERQMVKERWDLRDQIRVMGALTPMVVAAASAYFSVYVANKNFGALQDYLSLALVTAGTSTAVGAVTAILFKPEPTPVASQPPGAQKPIPPAA
ncbi:MAG: hypothetical protein NVSMB32_09620 [Actinomycetota bacterium]